ncbi:MerR family transcriptional regulator [uncultured Martelella sp.]|uniref:MerR family transcriptional regulator n=1 Tax=uncultured Martelella sp. TaxID=392331 RepID=UPI0029C7FF90|nr:MerR family transcriptional regulator [uncultured Martelella sp.]
MKIGELAKRSGLSVYTIRYYEKIGLLPEADRDRSGHRDYDPSTLIWIEFLGRLKITGMPISQMLQYAALRQQGAATEDQRRRLLEAHRATVRAHVLELQSCLAVLDTKIAGYAGGDEQQDKTTNEQPSIHSRTDPA